MLGPLVNPVLPQYQLLGVYNLKLARLYNYIYQESGIHYTIVHSLDGYDEVSLTSPFKVIDNSGEDILTPEQAGFPACSEKELSGGDTVAEAARIFDRVLAGTAGNGQINCVVANAAYAIKTLRPEKSLEEAIAEARASIDSGKAKKAFEKFVELNS